MIDVSIIIPHYEIPELLEVLLNSIPNISNIEVIVVDDGTYWKKKEYDECKNKFSNRNIVFLQNKSKGAGSARNTAMDICTGKWLLFADADDYFINNLWESIEEYINTDADIIYFAPTSKQLGANEPSNRHLGYAEIVNNFVRNPSHRNELMLRCTFYGPVSKLINRNFCVKNSIRFEDVLYSNDIVFSVKTGVYANKIKAVNKCIYCITESDKSLTKRKTTQSKLCRDYQFMKYYFVMRKNLSRKDMRLFGYGLVADKKFILRYLKFKILNSLVEKMMREE